MVVNEISKFICFDLEGPLSPQDNAYELMKLFPGGDKIFEVISRYDDLLALAGKEGYQPGDTLALIVPFLILHGISEDDIITLATRASFTGGACDLIGQLQSAEWQIFCISTSYQQYAHHLTRELGINTRNVACTTFPLDSLRRKTRLKDSELLQQIEREILAMHPPDDDDRIKQTLDNFFWKRLPSTELGKATGEVKPVGGRRKVAALNKFADSYAQPLSQWIVVGDSITDSQMLQAVDQAGGLSIAFNANEYALAYATISLASPFVSDLTEILETWPEGHRKSVEIKVREMGGKEQKDNRNHFHWLSDRENRDDVIDLHQKMRRTVREEAAKLG